MMIIQYTCITLANHRLIFKLNLSRLQQHKGLYYNKPSAHIVYKLLAIKVYFSINPLVDTLRLMLIKHVPRVEKLYN